MEIWKDIKGYEGLYQVSNLGRVKSLERYKKTKYESFSLFKEIIKKQQTNEKGYLKVTLANNKRRKTFFVHRLVAEAFLLNPNNLPQINHKDENKQNNLIWVNEDGSIDYNKSNLEWCTNEYNCNYGSHKNNISHKLKRHPSICKRLIQLTPNDELVSWWSSASDASEQLNIHKSCISECCKGKQLTAGGFKWGYADNYEKIPFKVFDLEMYRKKVV